LAIAINSSLSEAWNSIRSDSSYVPRIYGSQEAGGGSALFVSDVSGGTILSALYWITQRRDVAIAEAEEKAAINRIKGERSEP